MKQTTTITLLAAALVTVGCGSPALMTAPSAIETKTVSGLQADTHVPQGATSGPIYSPRPAPEPEPEAVPAPAPSSPAPSPSSQSQPAPEGPCGATPCAPPEEFTCPPGMVVVLGDVLTCEPAPETVVCPAGTHPVLKDTIVCEPDN
jgi:hypothetical protein